jgi:hypothetical protein
MTDYKEKLSSKRTEALFLLLSLFFFGLSLRRAASRRAEGAGPGRLTVVFTGLGSFFLFYALNYRILSIHITPEVLKLRFGLFTWKIAMSNIDSCFLDDTSLWRIGGAGIHFSPIKGRYRAMFNFLEYPRVVVSLKQKQGPVQDVAFSTQEPEKVLRLIRDYTADKIA